MASPRSYDNDPRKPPVPRFLRGGPPQGLPALRRIPPMGIRSAAPPTLGQVGEPKVLMIGFDVIGEMVTRDFFVGERRLRELDQNAVSVAGMNERFLPGMVLYPHVDRLDTSRAKVLDGSDDVRHLERHVVHALAAPVEKSLHEPVG
jgi:hypothetical protein